ncbi:hypothetical protein BKA70DRAFT_1224380 [Coprinopsis sp. MPI-PUGE-AT-0042]|nr:hypothetical protein BKA70DRAFT_1224380 [Coprinopsis sp. MPI-PUGE-AT-0042]
MPTDQDSELNDIPERVLANLSPSANDKSRMVGRWHRSNASENMNHLDWLSKTVHGPESLPDGSRIMHLLLWSDDHIPHEAPARDYASAWKEASRDQADGKLSRRFRFVERLAEADAWDRYSQSKPGWCSLSGYDLLAMTVGQTFRPKVILSIYGHATCEDKNNHSSVIHEGPPPACTPQYTPAANLRNPFLTFTNQACHALSAEHTTTERQAWQRRQRAASSFGVLSK